MKRIIPNDIYLEKPCSMVAVGTARGETDRRKLKTPEGLKADGYLSLNNMTKYIKENLGKAKKVVYKRGERPLLREWVHSNIGKKAIVCCLGHFVYVDGKDYYSYFPNGGDEVVCVWILEGSNK